jgi:S-adenosyl-L-methionine hydrolase (adenosine-forming)
MRRSGIITLTTDFGERDPFVGVMRGVIWSRHPGARIADLTHQIAPQSVREGAFWLERAFRWFPQATVHVAVVDPGVGTSRGILAVKAEGHLFLAPDNGLLGPVLELKGAKVVRVAPSALAALGVERWSATFHGRDIFAPLAAELARGRARIRDLGDEISHDMLVPSALARAIESADGVEGAVAAIDRFGNLITNIPGEMVAQRRVPRVRVQRRELELCRTYGDAKPGAYVALVGSFDRLEIACVNGNAASGLSVGLGEPVTIASESPGDAAP